MARRRYGSFTPARRAALRKAQLASARKRKRNKRIVAGAAVLAGAGALAVGRHKLSGSGFQTTHHPIVSPLTGNLSGTKARSLINTRHGVAGRKRSTGRSVGLRTAKHGPLGSHKTVVYRHNKLTKTVLGNKTKQFAADHPKLRSTGYRLAYKTRKMRGKGNALDTGYDKKSSYGVRGKHIPRTDSYLKFRGGKRVAIDSGPQLGPYEDIEFKSLPVIKSKFPRVRGRD